jgi:NADH:ubiquinone oxidoreductase subunit 5 (subunit L)/multisubunit Na+/H+ antiporter MnhA subunit
MEHLGGLIKKMPVTAFFFLAGALAIVGLPPFNGFVSEFLIYSGLIDGIKSNNVQFSSLMILSISGLAIAGGISMLTFTKSFGTIFLGSPRMQLEHAPKEVSLIMRIPLYIILSLMLFIGIFPNIVLIPVYNVIAVFSSSPTCNFFSPLSETLSVVGRVSLLMLLFVFLIYFIRKLIIAPKSITVHPTWGCGYTAPNTRMQYTGKSFSKTFAKLFSYITKEKKKYTEIESDSIFPAERTFHSNYTEFFETNIFDRLNNRIIGFMDYFTFIHNGKIQAYLLYGFFFIVGLLAATFFDLL